MAAGSHRAGAAVAASGDRPHRRSVLLMAGRPRQLDVGRQLQHPHRRRCQRPLGERGRGDRDGCGEQQQQRRTDAAHWHRNEWHGRKRARDGGPRRVVGRRARLVCGREHGGVGRQRVAVDGLGPSFVERAVQHPHQGCGAGQRGPLWHGDGEGGHERLSGGAHGQRGQGRRWLGQHRGGVRHNVRRVGARGGWGAGASASTSMSAPMTSSPAPELLRRSCAGRTATRRARSRVLATGASNGMPRGAAASTSTSAPPRRTTATPRWARAATPWARSPAPATRATSRSRSAAAARSTSAPPGRTTARSTQRRRARTCAAASAAAASRDTP